MLLGPETAHGHLGPARPTGQQPAPNQGQRPPPANTSECARWGHMTRSAHRERRETTRTYQRSRGMDSGESQLEGRSRWIS
jgi:hypothetical protein